ncbi:MAG: cation:proton antiporter, partial [Planctomycetes bacterium]|nr:cation:proton antiporter [Planctomycetota bacterium]
GLTFLGTAILAVVAAVVARYVLPIAFKWIAKLPELTLVVALGWCFGVATFGEHLESVLGLIGLDLPKVNVSSGMGALIAGTTIASLPYAHHVVSKVAVVRDFFVTLFFVALGMSIPAPESIDVILLAVAFAGISILARYFIFFPVMYFTGLDRRNAFVSSTKLAQVSEFCLVIAYLGQYYEHIDSNTVSAVIFAFVITALITPSLFSAGDAMHDKFGGLLSKLGFKAPATSGEKADAHHSKIVFLGFHRVASSLLHEIGVNRPEMIKEVSVVDFNVALHGKINATGAHVHYGDISNDDMLIHLGVDKAQVIVSTIPDDVLKGTSNEQLTRMLRGIAPDAYIIANANTAEDAQKSYAAGASYVYMGRIETARAILPALDAALGDELESYVEDRNAGPEILAQRVEVLP